MTEIDPTPDTDAHVASDPADPSGTPPRIPGLSRERIVDAAVEVARQDGLESLSMRKLAGEMGVSTMAAYRHVDGKEQLLDAAVDAVVSEVEMPPSDQAWDVRLEELILETHRVTLEVPGVAERLQGRAADWPGVARVLGGIADLVRASGAPEPAVTPAVMALVWALRGSSRLVDDWDVTRDLLDQIRTGGDGLSEVLSLDIGERMGDRGAEHLLREQVRLLAAGLRAATAA